MGSLGDVVIIGAGGHGRELFGLLTAAGVGVSGFVDDRRPELGLLERLDAKYLGTVADLETMGGVSFVIGIGSGSVRAHLADRLSPARPLGHIMHPSASVDQDVRFAEGCLVFAQATVTTNIDVGRHTHIGRGCAVGHDSVIADFVTLMPLASISGNVSIGERATVGSGAVVRQGQNIGADAYVGAGAVVVADVPAGVTVVGNPARPIRR